MEEKYARLLHLVKEMRDCQRRLDRFVVKNMGEDDFDNITTTMAKERQVDELLKEIDEDYNVDADNIGGIYL